VVSWQCEKLPGTYSQGGLTSGGGLTALTRLQHNFFYEKTPFNARKSFPHALYVREGRRLHGEYVMGSHDVQQDANSSRARFHPNSITRD